MDQAQSASQPSAQALLSMNEALERLSRIVSPTDARTFQSTTLKDVFDAAQQIQQHLAARGSLRNMRRIEPFFRGLEHYSKAVDTLCNGTPYLPWIWAPIKLILQLALDHITIFEKLIEAYGRIADVLPRFDRIGAAFKDDHDVQQVLAIVYADILAFHERAYKIIRRPGKL